MAKKNQEEGSLEEMRGRLFEIDKELFELQNRLSLERKLEKPHLLRAKRKEKARILTRITQREQQKGVRG